MIKRDLILAKIKGYKNNYFNKIEIQKNEYLKDANSK